MDDEKIAGITRDLLQNLGYKAEFIGNDIIGSAASGLNFEVIAYSSSLQFRCAMNIAGESGFDGSALNARNWEKRFSKVYTVEGNALILELDWWIDFEADDTALMLKRAMGMWEVALSSFKDWMRQIRQEQASARASTKG